MHKRKLIYSCNTTVEDKNFKIPFIWECGFAESLWKDSSSCCSVLYFHPLSHRLVFICRNLPALPLILIIMSWIWHFYPTTLTELNHCDPFLDAMYYNLVHSENMILNHSSYHKNILAHRWILSMR